MKTTTFTINLDPKISPTIYPYVYFAAFDQQGRPVPINNQSGAGGNVIKLISDGAVSPVKTATVAQGGDIPASNFYVVMQENKSAGDLSSSFTTNGAFTPSNAAANGYYYTMLEADLTPKAGDQMDISALNNYGPNVSFNINGLTPGELSSSGFGASLNTIISLLPSTAVQGAGTNTPMLLGPNGNADQWPTSVWQPYLNDLIKNPYAAAGIKAAYWFGPTSTLNLHKLSISGSDATNAEFIMSPLFPGLPGTNAHTVKMSYSSLQNAIYAPTFENSADGYVKSVLVSGFDSGLWGANTTYTNPNTTRTAVNPASMDVATIDLSNSWNWRKLYNYDGAAAKSQGVTTIDINNILPHATYDKFAAAIAASGNPYGYTFSDLLSLGGFSPAPGIWTGSQDAANITINVFANSTTPTPTSNPPSGFVPSPTGYLAPETTPPNGWHYQPAKVFVGPGEGNFLQVDTRVSGIYHPDLNYPLTFRIYSPQSSQAGADGFVSYDLATTSASSKPWSNWVINSDFTISNKGVSGLAGFFSIDNIPSAPGNDIAWYQLVIGKVGSPEQTVYDIYSNNTNGSITSFTTDPGVLVVPIHTPGGDKLALANSGSLTYNPLSFFDYNDLQAAVMYQMVLNKATPDKEGLTHWSDYLAAGHSELGMANTMIEFLQQQQPDLSNEDFVTLLYEQGFGREPDGEGLGHWTSQLDNGAMTRGQVAVAIADSLEMWGNQTIKGVYSAAAGISTVVDWNF